jgi:hypothetical protein
VSIWKGQSSSIYELPQVKEFLAISNGGESAYMWIAEYVDGTQHSQFPPEQFDKFQKDSSCMPSISLGKSVGKLDVAQVKELILVPTAHARAFLPWLTPVRLVVQPDKGEKFISYRLCDMSTIIRSTDGKAVGSARVTRYVVGISQYANGAQVKTFVVLSPSGLVTVTSTEDMSYEGEGQPYGEK